MGNFFFTHVALAATLSVILLVYLSKASYPRALCVAAIFLAVDVLIRVFLGGPISFSKLIESLLSIGLASLIGFFSYFVAREIFNLGDKSIYEYLRKKMNP